MTAYSQQFGRQVAARRRCLGLTVSDVSRNGGPASPTVLKAEAGELEDPRPSTLSKFDTALRWIPGSAASAYWNSEEPRPRAAKSKRVLAPAATSVALPIERVLALMTTQSALHDLVDEHLGDSVAVSDIRPVVSALNEHVSAIVGLFVTDLLERNHATDDDQLQPLLEYAFGEVLSAPVDPSDFDAEEKLYRRWLLGRTDGLDAAAEETFRTRLRRRHRRD